MRRRDIWIVISQLLPVPSRSITRAIRFSPTNESAVFRRAIPALSSEVVYAGWHIEPDHHIVWAVLLSLLLRQKLGLCVDGSNGTERKNCECDCKRCFHWLSPSFPKAIYHPDFIETNGSLSILLVRISIAGLKAK
jgi:hypothetical protein